MIVFIASNWLPHSLFNNYSIQVVIEFHFRQVLQPILSNLKSQTYCSLDLVQSQASNFWRLERYLSMHIPLVLFDSSLITVLLLFWLFPCICKVISNLNHTSSSQKVSQPISVCILLVSRKFKKWLEFQAIRPLPRTSAK